MFINNVMQFKRNNWKASVKIILWARTCNLYDKAVSNKLRLHEK